MRGLWGLVGLTVLTCGCGRQPPTLAGGKPVEYWTQEMKSPNAKARRHAVAKLGNVGVADTAMGPSFCAALNDSDAGVRGEAILGLMKCGPAAADAIPALAALQAKDRDAHVREYAGKALEKLRGDTGKP